MRSFTRRTSVAAKDDGHEEQGMRTRGRVPRLAHLFPAGESREMK